MIDESRHTALCGGVDDEIAIKIKEVNWGVLPERGERSDVMYKIRSIQMSVQPIECYSNVGSFHSNVGSVTCT